MTETKKLPSVAVASLSSGVLLCDFGKVAEVASWIMGHPIYTHQYPMLRDDIERAVAAQFPDMPTRIEGVTPENYRAHATEIEKRFGKTVSVVRGSGLTELLPTDGIPAGVELTGCGRRKAGTLTETDKGRTSKKVSGRRLGFH